MQRIRSIVVPTDFSPLAESVAARAVLLAGLDGASIHLVHAVRFPLVTPTYEVSVPAAVWEGIRSGAREKLEERRKAFEGRGVTAVSAEVAETGDPAIAIATAAESHGADLIVMGTHGHGGLRHAFLGSVAERTIRTAERPVLAVKEEPEQAAKPIRRILLAVDFSPHSERAVELVAGLAPRLEASVDVLHAIHLPRDYMPYASDVAMEFEEEVQTRTAEGLERVRGQLADVPAGVTLHVRRGRPSQMIAEAAEELGTQLVVMGTRGHGGLGHLLLGSVAERTLRTAPCSVLVVKAEEGDA